MTSSPVIVKNFFLIVFLFKFFLFSIDAFSSEKLGRNTSVRALGMGNAYVGVADDLDALFYNPAGLAKVRGLQLHLLSAKGAARNLTDFKDLSNLSKSTNLAQDLSALYGNHYYFGGGGKTGVAIPMFGAAIYDSANFKAAFNSPPYTQIDVSALNDFGYAVGFGVPLGPFFQIGADGRFVKRTGTETTYSGGTLANLSTSQITSDLTNWGVGYALDVGMNVVIPGPLFALDIGAAWQNVGNTAFIAPKAAHIPGDHSNLTAGFAGRFDLPLIRVRPAVDFTHITEEDVQLWRKFNFGLEIGLPLIDLRAGFSEGYYTWGFGIDLGLMKVDAASYGVELGDYPGQIQDRRYVAQVTIEIDLGGFHVADDGAKDAQQGSNGKSGAANGKGYGGNGTGGSSKQNVWGSTHHLKERR